MAETKSPAASREKYSDLAQNPETPLTLSGLQANADLWYKIHVLLHDLCKIASDRAAEARTLATTDELYISDPYFSPEEATLIKSTTVSPPTLNEIPEFELLNIEDETNLEANAKSTEKEVALETMTIEAAIKSCLQNFYEKRRASGDARPCGPHDMGPIYLLFSGLRSRS